ncbi:MAG: penicillin-binding protein [Acidobacteriota bacterium]
MSRREARRVGRRRAGSGRVGRRPRGPGSADTRERRKRLILLGAAVAAGLLALGARCAHLQILKAPELIERARAQQEKAVVLHPHRGPILDRNGKELALSLAVDSVYADPSCLEDPERAAPKLARVLGMRTSDVRRRLDCDRHFVWLRRKITPDLRDRIERLGLRGVGFVRESRRFYPKRTLAAHVLGACGVDNQGLAGLEFAFDKTIRGVPGRILFLRDGRGGRVLDRARTEPIPGAGLVLTLDAVIQHAAERGLDAAMRDTDARGAAAVVLRPRTGEVLALANRPTFDPNTFSRARAAARRNRAVSDFSEPGSTFKAIIAAAVLEAGLVRPEEVIWCGNGSITVARHRFREDSRPFGELTFTEVLSRSSNVGAIRVASRMRPADLLEALRRFGFGSRTGIELPAESGGLLRDVSDWSGLSQASIAIGQEIGVTPLQLAAAFGAIANDGVWVRPHIVGDDAGGRHRRAAAGRRRVVSVGTARDLRAMLTTVVSRGGTGEHAALPGYSAAGKTGTAQKIDEGGRYSRDKHVAWFAGFAPAERPEIVVVVMVDEPRGRRFHGGQVAAPVFSRIALAALRYLGVPPDRDGTLIFDRPARAARRDGRGLDPAVPAVHRFGAPPRSDGRGRRQDGRVQAALAALRRSRPATRAGAPAREERPPVPMPDLSGMSLRQATETLAAVGLVCRMNRSGARVTRQAPRAGTPVKPGAACVVTY